MACRLEETTVCVDLCNAIDYSDMCDYIQAWPDKLVAFVVDHLVDDDMKEFAGRLYEYICEPDKNGPGFEDWRKS